MERIQQLLRAVDRFQQRHGVPAFVVGVVKKFGDDQGGKHAALLAYYGFVSLFPLLLVLATTTAYLVENDPDLQQRVIDAVVAQFPVVGLQLRGSIGTIRGSGLGLLIGVLGTLWGGLGITQTAQDAMNAVWNVPRRDRPNFWLRLVRSGGVLLLAAAALFGATWLAGHGAVVPGRRDRPAVAELRDPVPGEHDRRVVGLCERRRRGDEQRIEPTGRDRVLHLVERHGVGDARPTRCQAPQRHEVATDAQRTAQVVGEGPHVGAGRAADQELDLSQAPRHEVLQHQVVDDDRPGLALDLLAVASAIAMGGQTAVAVSWRPDVPTTYVTGTLTALIGALGDRDEGHPVRDLEQRQVVAPRALADRLGDPLVVEPRAEPEPGEPRLGEQVHPASLASGGAEVVAGGHQELSAGQPRSRILVL